MSPRCWILRNRNRWIKEDQDCAIRSVSRAGEGDGSEILFFSYGPEKKVRVKQVHTGLIGPFLVVAPCMDQGPQKVYVQ